MVVINSAIIALRTIELNDAKSILYYRSKPEIYRYQSWKPSTLQEVRDFITTRIVQEPNINDSWFQLAIIEKATNQLIGDVGLHFFADQTDQVEIGITLRKENQGKGLATEVLRLVFDYVFITLKKHRIIASVDPQNIASIRLLKRIGMRKEAHFRKSIFLNGAWQDDIIYAILEEEWHKK
jgi:RimJ/RimL family protein N-acetyltransferase